MGRISRVSDVRRLHIGKVKGTLVNFNELEHVLDDIEAVGSWQLELRKRNDDPLDCDEIVVHVAPTENGRSHGFRESLSRRIEARFVAETEVRPNQIRFHDAEAMRRRQGVGNALKEEKVVDNRAAEKPAKPSTDRKKTLNPLVAHELS